MKITTVYRRTGWCIICLGCLMLCLAACRPSVINTPQVETEKYVTPVLQPKKNPVPPQMKRATTPPAIRPIKKEPPPVEKDFSSTRPHPRLPAATMTKKRLGYHQYSYITSFGGSGMGEGSFDHAVAIAVDSQNNIYVVDQGNDLIQKFDRNGEYLGQWGKSGTQKGEFDTPSAIAIDKNDIVYVVDTNNNRVQLFNSKELEKPEFTTFGSLGSGEGKFQTPTDIAIDDENNIYVLDSGNTRVQKFKFDTGEKKWKFEEELGSYGSCRECFLAPSKLAYDSTGFGYLYVLDQNRQGFILQKIDTDKTFLKPLDVFHSKECPILNPVHIYFDIDGFLYIVDQKNGCVCKFNTDGQFIQKIGDPSSSEAEVSNPQSVIQDSDKRLLILDSDLIKIFDQM